MPTHKEQYEYTDRKIKDAFLSLLNTKDYESITISDICRKSGIHRTTIDRHYESKEAILEDIKNDLYKTHKECLDEKDNNITNDLTLILLIVKENQSFFKARLIKKREEFQLNAMQKYLREKYYTQLSCSDNLKRKIDKNTVYNYKTGGANVIIMDWLNNGCKKDCHELVHDIIELFNID